MLTRMRRLFIVISVLVLVLAASAGAAYMYVQNLLSKLPVENLNYQVAGFGYKHIHLSQLSFTYVEPARDIDALSSGFQSGEPKLQAPVMLEDIFVTWEWHGFRPNLQIVEIEHLKLALSHWPELIAENEQTDSQALTLPEDWRIPQSLPHQVSVANFAVQLPCVDTCHYSGQLHFESENKELLLFSDEPQHSHFRLAVSPHQNFEEMEQLNIYLDYEVVAARPALQIEVQSPLGFALQSSHQLDSANNLSGDLEIQMSPAFEWVFDEVWRWLPQLAAPAEPALSFINAPLTLQANYQSRLPQTSLARWVNEIDFEISGGAELETQLAFNFESTLQRGDQIAFDGHLAAVLLPDLRNNIQSLLTQPLATEINDEQLAQTLFAQLNSPVVLNLDWALGFPPGAEINSWPDQVDGQASFELGSESTLTLADFVLTDLASQADVFFNAGLVTGLDFMLSGATELGPTEALTTLGLDLGRLHWSMHLNAPEYLDWQSIPLHLQAQSTGASDISIDTQLQFDLADTVTAYTSNHEQEPEATFAQLTGESEHGLIILRQPHLDIATLNINEIELRAPFTLQFNLAEHLRIEGTDPATLSMSLQVPLQDETVNLPQLQLELADWHWLSPIHALPESEFQTQLDLNITSAEIPTLRAINWRWLGSLEAQPLQQSPTYMATGRLTNSAGIVVNNQVHGDLEQVTLDWQLSDIFWLAGNPIAGTLDNLWPELLNFERGRTRAQGQVVLPLTDAPMHIDAELELMDVAGIYDTASFSGLSSYFVANSDGEDFSIHLSDSFIQRFEYGMTHGPGDLQLTYQGALDSPLSGTLEILENRLHVLNGVISLLPNSYNLSQPEHVFYIDISQLDIAQLLAEYPAAEINGSGLLSGHIPIRWGPEGVFVEQGQIAALPPGGQLSYRSERAQQLAQSNMAMGVVMDVLDDFHYSALEGDVTYLEDGTLQLGLLLEGHNPSLEQGRPVRLELTLQEDLPALLTSLQLANQLNEVIQERIQQRLIQRLGN